jgi:pyruvate dehydrogenase E1 component beta subunit
MAELSYREAVAAGIAQEMRRDESVIFIGEDVAAAGGVFKTTEGLQAEFGSMRVRDTPIAEQAIVANGGGVRFGAQHSQSVENWAMSVPGLKVVAPSTPADVKGLLAASIRDPDPVLFFEQKSLYGIKGEVPDDEHVEPLGSARVRREGSDVTIAALAAMVPKAMRAADVLENEHNISATVIDVRTLVPLDTSTIFEEVKKTGRLVTVEENPRLCGWGAEISSLVVEEMFWDLEGPIVRVTTPHVPLPAADALEDSVIPSVERIVDNVLKLAD